MGERSKSFGSMTGTRKKKNWADDTPDHETWMTVYLPIVSQKICPCFNKTFQSKVLSWYYIDIIAHAKKKNFPNPTESKKKVQRTALYVSTSTSASDFKVHCLTKVPQRSYSWWTPLIQANCQRNHHWHSHSRTCALWNSMESQWIRCHTWRFNPRMGGMGF